ncbi:hypothetical protein MKO06_16345 [Gramella sp. GC03-9]|uniref:Uncharacterized protein n=1 Tax=Christiangramia oceanisediminis TaxID=2920386 RepID=A0A9X2L075_9FLAO|nr:hypothetical protein [Gramella oceanisediminis]MCP9201481.1 hypothetical protein [Gramella oceanisediminis]
MLILFQSCENKIGTEEIFNDSFKEILEKTVIDLRNNIPPRYKKDSEEVKKPIEKWKVEVSKTPIAFDFSYIDRLPPEFSFVRNNDENLEIGYLPESVESFTHENFEVSFTPTNATESQYDEKILVSDLILNSSRDKAVLFYVTSTSSKNVGGEYILFKKLNNEWQVIDYIALFFS